MVGQDAFRTATGVQAAAVNKALRLKNAELADNVYSGVPAHEFGLEQIIEVGLRDIHSLAPFLGFTPFRVIGALLIAAVIPVLLESFGRFALQGIDPPAPVFPTRNLVVKGFYRYVRNPMYVAVVSLILSQALLLGDTHIRTYAILVWLVMHFFVLTYEEPT